MPSLVQGSIVYALESIPDPQGRNAKSDRPAVVISRPAEIETGAELTLAMVSTTITGDPCEVELPYGPNCRTGLRVRSVAKCNWIHRVAQDKVESRSGFVVPRILKEILDYVDRNGLLNGDS